MAPPFLTGNVYYHQDVGVVDVQTIINEITTLATTAMPAWTNPLAGKIVSPADASGRQITIQFNRISATNLEMVVTDGQARTVTRRAQITTTTIDYYISQFHMVLDFSNGEGLAAFMLDESPELETSHNMWVTVMGARNVANAVDFGWVFGSYFPVRSGNAFALLNNAFLSPNYNSAVNGGSNGYESRTVGGSNLWVPLIIMGDNPNANIFNIYGKLYNALQTRGNINNPGSEVSVPIDQSTSAIFRVLNMPPWAPGGITFQDRMAIRKS